MVNYQVQYKMIHPTQLSPVTNKTLVEYNASDSSRVNITDKDPKCDMIFYCHLPLSQHQGNLNASSKDEMRRINQDYWLVYANCASLKQAQIVARKIGAIYGIENVQVCKLVPISSEILFEES